MKRPPPGRTITVTTQGESFQAFVPAPLPPKPPLEWSPALRRKFDEALVAIGRLDAVSALLPNAELLLYSFVRQEAVLSSQIEGTQSSLADLLLYEADEQPGVPLEDAREVSRCVAAMAHGLDRLRGGFPLSLRLLRESPLPIRSAPARSAWIGPTMRRAKNTPASTAKTSAASRIHSSLWNAS